MRLQAARLRGRHTSEQWRDLREVCNWACVCCGEPESVHGPWRLTRDHIVPLARGGSDAIENLQPLCPSCNSRKGTHSMLDFRPRDWRHFVFGEAP
jgi:5-methylcytosine-specific restriction endonuclease McrA